MTIKERIAKLIDVKTLVTLALTGVVCYLAIKGEINIQDIYIMIIGFYFGTQVNKNKDDKK